MNVKIDDVMAHQVVTVQPHHTIAHVRAVMERNRVHALPVVGPDNEVRGIISSSDLIGGHPDGAHVSSIMTTPVWCLPRYNNVDVAATVMRKHHVHHIIVTHDRKVVGIVSAFDLLQLVESRRFVEKAGSTRPSKTHKQA